MAVKDWSQTAASNATADSAINLREGQAPSTLNNAGRGIMAELAKYRDDIAGSIVTGGGSTAYTVTTAQGLGGSLSAGFMVSFVAHTTNGEAPELNVDSSGLLPLRGLTGVDLPAGVLIEGTPYTAVLNADMDEWMLHGYRLEPSTVPLGGMIPYVGTSAPNSSFVLPYGQAISRTTYAGLFALCGTTFGVGDESTTFNIPDIRGRAIFGLDNMGGAAASRITSGVSGIDGASRGAAGGAQAVTLARANLPNDNVSVNITDPGHTHSYNTRNAQNTAAAGSPPTSINQGLSGTSTGSAATGITAAFDLNGGVSQTDVNKMPPCIVLPYIMRVI